MNTRRTRIYAALATLVAFGGLAGATRLLAFIRPLAEATDTAFLGRELDYAGVAVAADGDVNGDGVDDMLIGADLGQSVDGRQRGRAYLVLGRAGGGWPDPTGLASADAGFLGEGHLDHAGTSVAHAGDVNGDGLGDFLVGAMFHSPTAVLTNAGRAYLVLGRRAADWGTDFQLAQADASFDGAAPGDYAGRSVAGAGDVNGDGLADFLVGAYLARGMQGRTGCVYLFLGRREASWGRGVSLSQADAIFLGQKSNDYAGMAVAGAGDVNGDRLDDVLIGAHGGDDVGQSAGKAYLILGRRAADWGKAFPLIQADSIFLGSAAAHRAGVAVSGVGDVNRDGIDDFAVGASGREGDQEGGGRAYLLLGRRAADYGVQFDLVGADTVFRGTSMTEAVGAAIVGAGDVNRDGFDDFVIGATHPDPPGGRYDAGRCYLVFGRERARPARVDLVDQEIEPAADIVALDGREAGEAACVAVAGAGDVNDDGFDDLVVGAPYSSEAARLGGKAYLVLGKGVVFAKRAMHSWALRGDVVTYTMAYTSTLAEPLGEVRVVDSPPAGLDYVRCFGGLDCGLDGRLVAWNVGAIPPHGRGAVGLVLRVPPAVAPGTRITNTALVTSPLLVNPLRSAAVVRVVLNTPTPRQTATASTTPTATGHTPGRPTATATLRSTATPSATGTNRTPTSTNTAHPTATGATGEPRRSRVYLPVAARS